MEKTCNCKSRSIQILAVFFFLLLSLNIQAQNSWVTSPNAKKISPDKDGPYRYYYKIENGELKILKMEGPKEVVKIIVTLKDKPIALYKSENALRKRSLTSILSSLKQAHSNVTAKIENIATRLSTGSNFQYSYKINREYFTAINGMTIECNRAMIQQIRELPEVKNVYLDREVKAFLTESVSQIRADIVQDSLGYTGDDILVGVIDTGIDYNHSALGGGYGPAYRVIGGYDFINDDSNPYDDNGHGTHVAGIIGANGNSDQIGVAPNVKFLAVKVLDDYGGGAWSGVIAGIEYCMDPDGIPETEDAVDIINMSLGGPPVADNPVDAAVNNATQAGILSVIAAGNSGNDVFLGPFQTIGSPGTAETALTVGACNSNDQTANFSSRGPDAINFAIKPEVIAPGVDILSLLPGNTMERMSGTSMATPHVAGVAALLKEQHPDWTPKQIKAAIINSAKSTGGSLFMKGNGRVDALNAATLGVIVEPGIASFGLVDLAESVWMDTLEIKIKNLRNTSQNFNLEILSSLPAEVDLYLSQTSFELAPMEDKEITAIISVPNSVPIIGTQPFAYTGYIICQSDSDQVQIPFGFIKSNVLVIECDIYPLDLSLFYGPHGDGQIDILYRTAGTNNKFIVTVPNRSYTLWAWLREEDATNHKYYDYFIVRNDVKVEGLKHITLHHSEAEFSAFNGVDQLRDVYDNPVTLPDSCPISFDIVIIHPNYYALRTFEYIGWEYNDLKIFLSFMDERFIVHQDMIVNNGDQSILLADFTKGVQSQDDLTFLSGSQNLADLHLNFDYTKREMRGPYIQLDKTELWGGMEAGWTFLAGHALPNMEYVHFMTPKLSEEFDPMQYLAMSIGIGDYSYDFFGFSLPSASAATADFYIDNSRNFVFFDRKFFRPDQSDYVNIMTSSSGDTLYISEDCRSDVLIPKFQFLYQYYNMDLGLTQFSPNLYDDGGVSCSNGMHGQAFQNMSPGFKAQMYSQNRLLQANNVPSYPYVFYYDYTVKENANRYRLLANTQWYKILGQIGHSTIDYEFNVTEPVVPWKCFMPSLDLFQVLENDKSAQWLHPGQDKKVRLVIFDPKENVDSVSVHLLKNDGSEIGLATTQTSQKEYFASIPDNIPNGFLDVIARVHNAEGNKFELAVSPAFYSGSTMDSLNLNARVQMISQTMDNPDSVEFIAGDTLKYTLTFINWGNKVAKDITVHFPETDYFMPVGNTLITVDSLRIDIYGRRYKFVTPLRMVFLGNRQPEEKQCYYYPTITWKSGERSFTRKHKILVDFEGTPTSIRNFENATAGTFALSQNFPNPFNPATTISYIIPRETKVKLEVFNMLGQKVGTLVDKKQPAGRYEVVWDATGFTSGIYFCRIVTNKGFTETKKLLLLK